jgi:type II secretory pathway component GspD/PulD (secretin)
MRRFFLAVILGSMLGSNVFAQERHVSIDVRDANLSDVIALLAAESGKNIVADGSLKPDKITLHLTNVSFEDALSVLVHSRDLSVRREGDILIIGTNLVMNRRYGGAGDDLSTQTAVLPLRHAKAEEVARSMIDALSAGTVVVPDKRTGSIIVTGDSATVSRARSLVAALDTARFGINGGSSAHAFQLRYLRPSEVIAQLKDVLPDGSYVADDRQNAIVVTGNPEVQETAQAFLVSVDVAAPQVMFEVKVADLQPQNDQSNVGIEWGGLDLTGKVFPGGSTYAFTKNAVAVNATLNAMVTNGHATILATPKLVTLNNREADLLIGQTYPVVFYDAKIGGQQVQFVDIGVKLRLTPTIGSDGSVTAEMHPEYSAIQSFVDGYPVLANRKVDSVLRVNDGQTIVLGGLLRDIDSDTVTKVPGLSDIPVFGQLFRNRTHSRERDEVVFLITPHILRGNSTVTH